MNKRIILALAVLLAAVTAAAQTKYTVNVGDFYELLVKDAVNVEYRCNPDSAGIAVFTTTPDITSRILFSNSGSNLKIELSKDEGRLDSLRGLPIVYVYSTFLSKAESRGDSTLVVCSPAPGPQLKLKLEGNGRIVARDVHVTTLEANSNTGHGEIMVYGKCKDAKLKISGKGTIKADRLNATSVKCSLFGKGEVTCNVNGGDLTLQGVTGATVGYRGKPANIKNRTTKAKLINLDDVDAAKPQN